MSNVFSEVDFSLRRCRKDEIGMPWEDRWSIEDFVDELCDEDHVGQSKVVPKTIAYIPAAPAPVVPIEPMTRSERKIKLQQVADGIIRYAAAHPEAMLDDNGAQVNKLLDLFSKMDDREEERKPGFSVENITQETLHKMSISDLKRLAIHNFLQYVPENRREEALRAYTSGETVSD